MREVKNSSHLYFVWIILFRTLFHEAISSVFRNSFWIKNTSHINPFLCKLCFSSLSLSLYFADDPIPYFYKVLCNQIYQSSFLLLLNFESYIVRKVLFFHFKVIKWFVHAAFSTCIMALLLERARHSNLLHFFSFSMFLISVRFSGLHSPDLAISLPCFSSTTGVPPAHHYYFVLFCVYFSLLLLKV